MSINEQHQDDVKVEEVKLDDGRRGERHVVKQSDKEVVEIFAEQKPVLKLENRIIRETKTVVVKEIHQKLNDGNVVSEEVFEVSPEAFSLTKNVTAQAADVAPESNTQAVVEEKVNQDKSKDNLLNTIMVIVILVQIALLVGFVFLK